VASSVPALHPRTAKARRGQGPSRRQPSVIEALPYANRVSGGHPPVGAARVLGLDLQALAWHGCTRSRCSAPLFDRYASMFDIVEVKNAVDRLPTGRGPGLGRPRIARPHLPAQAGLVRVASK
jgi:hypothetical protein